MLASPLLQWPAKSPAGLTGPENDRIKEDCHGGREGAAARIFRIVRQRHGVQDGSRGRGEPVILDGPYDETNQELIVEGLDTQDVVDVPGSPFHFG